MPVDRQDAGGLAGLLASHSWLGLIGSWVLFAVFLTGALTMFKREIDLWEKAPAYFGSDARASAPLDAVLAQTVVPPEVKDPHLEVLLPGPMSAYYQVFVYDDEGDYYRADAFHPHTGALLPPPEATGFGEFLEEFHKELYLPFGHYVVGVVTLLFFLGIVTGLVLYWPKLSWRSLTTIRASRPRLRWLDLHNTTGVFGVPFHLLMAFTGVVFNLAILFNAAVVWGRLGGNDSAVWGLRFAPPLPVAAAGQARPTRGTDALIADAARRLDAEPLRVSLIHYGDHNALFTVHVHGRGSFAQVGQVTYRVDDGSVARSLPPADINALAHGNEVLHRLHYGDYGGFALRLVYFLLAIGSCFLVATGNLLWIEKRLGQRKPPRSLRFVAALSAGTFGGMLVALAAAMTCARLLPVDGAARMSIVIGAFAASLGASHVFAAFVARPRRALIVLCLVAGVLFALLPVLDWLRFGAAHARAIAAGDYAVLFVEILCVAFAATCIACARWLARDTMNAIKPRFAPER